MKIEVVKVGSLETNCYILKIKDEVLVVDPGAEVEKIISHLGKSKVRGIIITHHHFDHDGVALELAMRTHTDIYDYHNLKVGKKTVGLFTFDVIATPGHKDDSISILFRDENVMFCGDFIFKSSIGRWDLQGGNFIEMKKSIMKILGYDDSIVLYPGHGETTILKDERGNLQKYLKCF